MYDDITFLKCFLIMLQMRYSDYYDSKTAQSRLKKLNRYPEYSLIPREIVCQATLTV